jgi:hypothetical protein
MANITQILGTDSISSSRPTINNNFTLLNDEIADIQALVDPNNSSIQNISSATVESLKVVNNSTNIADFTTSVVDIYVDFEMYKAATMAGEINKTGIEGSASSPTGTTSPSSLTESAYFVNTSFTLPAGASGQEITIINVSSGSVTVTTGSGVSLGASSLVLDGNNSTVTLRYIDSVWYVIASHAATIN